MQMTYVHVDMYMTHDKILEPLTTLVVSVMDRFLQCV